MFPAEAVALALDQYIDENDKPPTVAGIKKYLQKLDPDYDYEAMFEELWSAICGNKRFGDLCDINRKYIGSQQQIDALGQSEDTLYEVEKGLYMKRIASIVERTKFEDKATEALGSSGVRTLKDILRGHKRTDELPEVKISKLIEGK